MAVAPSNRHVEHRTEVVCHGGVALSGRNSTSLETAFASACRRVPVIMMLIVCAAFSDGCSQPAASRATGQPRTGPPQRIVSIVPAVTEMLFAIGAGPNVVAVSSFDTWPPEVKGLTKVGALLDPDIEQVIRLRPDLVVVYGTQPETRTKLERAGIAGAPSVSSPAGCVRPYRSASGPALTPCATTLMSTTVTVAVSTNRASDGTSSS